MVQKTKALSVQPHLASTSSQEDMSFYQVAELVGLASSLRWHNQCVEERELPSCFPGCDADAKKNRHLHHGSKCEPQHFPEQTCGCCLSSGVEHVRPLFEVLPLERPLACQIRSDNFQVACWPYLATLAVLLEMQVIV